MITLNEIAYNIRNLAYGGKNSSENNISLSQIKHWIHYHRAKLIADNINKGITNNQGLYQDMDITVGNSAQKNINAWFQSYINGLASDGVSSLDTTANGTFVENHPRDSVNLYGEWLSESSISNPLFTTRNNWYGNESSSQQNRGDYRNYGSHKFFIPKPIQLSNDEGIKDVRLARTVHQPGAPSTIDELYQSNFISIYRKDHYDFDQYNKFTNNSKPYYTQEVITDSTKMTATSDNVPNAFAADDEGTDGEKPFVDASNRCVLCYEQLQVTPNYHGNLTTPGDQNLFWKYYGKVSAILENPTSIATMWSLTDFRELKSSYNKRSLSNIKRLKWDDANNPYPVPMEFISDLIQRVVQIELQTELKTQSDEITDGLDDNMKGSGTQVQR